MPPIKIDGSTWFTFKGAGIAAFVIGMASAVWYTRGLIADNHEFQRETTKTLSALVVRMEQAEAKSLRNEEALNGRIQNWAVWREHTDNDVNNVKRELQTETQKIEALYERVINGVTIPKKPSD